MDSTPDAAAAAAAAFPPRRVLLFSQPRTTSHLLVRMLGVENRPDIHWGNYIPASRSVIRHTGSLSQKPVSDWTAQERQQVKAQFQEFFNLFDRDRIDGEKANRIVFAKEHCNFVWNPAAIGQQNAAPDPFFTVHVGEKKEEEEEEEEEEGEARPGDDDDAGEENLNPNPNPTVLPSAYLGSWTPVFIIRHPALVFPSYCRGALELHAAGKYQSWEHMMKAVEVFMSLSYTRRLYDWYACYNRRKSEEDGQTQLGPFLLDSQDVINSPHVVSELVARLGWERPEVQLTWRPREVKVDDSWDPVKRVFMSTVETSSRILKEKGRTPSYEEYSDGAQWKAEFGEDLGQVILDCVLAALPDYEYLRGKRLQPGENKIKEASSTRESAGSWHLYC